MVEISSYRRRTPELRNELRWSRLWCFNEIPKMIAGLELKNKIRFDLVLDKVSLFSLLIWRSHCQKMCCNCGTKVETTFILGIIYTLLNFLGSFGGPYGQLKDLESFGFLYFNVAIGLVATLFGGILIYGTSRYVSRKMKWNLTKSLSNIWQRFLCLQKYARN